MQVAAIDHCNIHTADMAGTIAFFREMLEMEPSTPPGMDPAEIVWMNDAQGRPVVHINRRADCATGDTGAFDHVALTCIGHAETLERLRAHGHGLRLTDLPEIGIRQIFVKEPNGVTIELTFRGD